MELARLKYLTRQCLAAAKYELTKTQNIKPFAEVVRPGGEIERVKFSAEWFAGPDFKKDVLFAAVGEHCRRVGAVGLIFVTDAWTLETPPAMEKRLLVDPEFQKAFEAARQGGIVEAAAAGFGRLTEALHCQGQTVDVVWGLKQNYERVAADGVIPPTTVALEGGPPLPPHKIRMRGDAEVLTTDHSDVEESTGRMLQLYKNGANSEIDPRWRNLVAVALASFIDSHIRKDACQNQNPTQR